MEELLKANNRKLSEIEIIVSPYTKTIVADDLKRYRDAGVHEIVIVNIRPPKTVEEAAIPFGGGRARPGSIPPRNSDPIRF